MLKELNFFNVIPIWGLFLATATVVLISLEAGYRLGRYRGALAEHEKEGSTGTMVGATLGLLAFLLAFTFNMASSRYDARRQAFLGEVNAIGNAFLRADLLQEPYRSKTRDLFRQYVDLRLEKLDPKEMLGASDFPSIWNQRKKKGMEPPDVDAWNRQIYAVRLLQQLTFDWDAQNIQNVLFDPSFRVYAIDFSRSFATYDQLRSEKLLERFPRAPLEAMKKLDAPMLHSKIGRWVSAPQIRALLKRRDRILAIAAKLVAEKGEAAVLLP